MRFGAEGGDQPVCDGGDEKEAGGLLAWKFVSAGIKDIILPGEIREIMNTVLLAEKRAQANVITRREEVASTRSLLNTARLMDENQTSLSLRRWSIWSGSAIRWGRFP